MPLQRCKTALCAFVRGVQHVGWTTFVVVVVEVAVVEVVLHYLNINTIQRQQLDSQLDMRSPCCRKAILCQPLLACSLLQEQLAYRHDWLKSGNSCVDLWLAVPWYFDKTLLCHSFGVTRVCLR